MANILVVDDDNLMREMLLQLLTLEGHSATGAENGAIAEKLMEKTVFDLVITDIVMPEKEGLEIIMHIHKSNPSIPIIAVSGGARIEPGSYLDIAKQLGAKYTFTKPINRSELVAAINTCIKNKSQTK
jgi:DNA-binding NtrC family response regulator